MSNTLSFASELAAPKNHHTSQAVWCFRTDPYVYYRTYVQEKLESPPVIRNTTEMLYKYELLLGSEKFDEKFDTRSPINPSTKKHYGEETQKFAEWSKIVRSEGKIPIHPSDAEAAHYAYLQTVEQINDGFAFTLKGLLMEGGQSGIQATALIDNSHCYAHVDHLSRDGAVGLVRMVHSLDKIKGSDLYAELAFTSAFWYTTLAESTVRYGLNSRAYVIIAEYNAPFRVSVNEINVPLWCSEVHNAIYKLNQSFNGTVYSSWKSPYHEPAKLV